MVVTLGTLAPGAPRGVVYIPTPRGRATPPRGSQQQQRPAAVSRTAGSSRVGHPTQGGGFGVGQSEALLQNVFKDPSVQQALQKQAVQKAQDNASGWDKLKSSLGTILQPLDYLAYGRRAVQTGLLELEEALTEKPNTSHWMRWLTMKPEQQNLFTPAAEVRAGRSNWDLIQGKPGVKPTDMPWNRAEEGKAAHPLGGGMMVQDLSGPDAGGLRKWTDRGLGLLLDIGEDPLTHTTTGGFRKVNPAVRATQTAEVAQEAARTQVNDLSKFLQDAAAKGKTLSQADIDEAVGRTAQQLELGQRAADRAATAVDELKDVKLPRNRLGRAQLAAELKQTLPADVYEKLLPDIKRAVTRGFEQASPELKEAAGISKGGLRLYGARIPGTAIVGEGIGALKAAGGAALPSRLGMIRDPKGLSEALDVLARNKPGDVDAAISRFALEDFRRVGEAQVRQEGSQLAKQFQAKTLDPLKKQGRQAIDDMIHQAETQGGTKFNELFTNLLGVMERVTGKGIDREFLLDKNTYVPHRLTAQFKRYLRKNAAEESVKAFEEQSAFMSDDLLDQAAAVTRKRAFKPDTPGVPKTFNLAGREFQVTDGSIRDLNQSLKDVFPDFQGKFYEDDPAQLIEGYLKTRAKEAGTNSALNRLAADPRFTQVQRVAGDTLDEVNARNAALARDPLQELVGGAPTTEQAARFAEQNLGAPTGPTATPEYGPALPNRETQTFDNPMFRNAVDREATIARNKALSGEATKDFRVELAKAQRKATTSIRDDVEALRQAQRESLGKLWQGSGVPASQKTRLINSLKERLRKLDLKEVGAEADLEATINESSIQISRAEEALQEARDAVGPAASRAERKVLKEMEDHVAALNALHDEAMAKLESAPARMREEISQRTAALHEPIKAAETKIQQIRDAMDRVGPSRTRVRNAERALSEAPEAFARDQARLAEASGVEARILKRKFARDGEYGRFVRAQKVLEENATATQHLQPDLKKAQDALEAARLRANQQQEAVIRGEFLPEQQMLNPETGDPLFQTIRAEGPWPVKSDPLYVEHSGPPTVQDPATGQPVLQPWMEPAQQTYRTGTEGGFGAGQVREYVPPAQMTPEEAAGQQAAQRARLGAEQQGLPPTGTRSEQQALGALEAEAQRVETGQPNQLLRRAQGAQRRAEAAQQELAAGVPADHPEVQAAQAQAEANVAQAEQGVQQATTEAGVREQAATDRITKIQQDKAQRSGELDQAIADRDVLKARRKYNEQERRMVQRELKKQVAGMKPGKNATLDELGQTLEDLNAVALMDPRMNEVTYRSTEAQLNRVADGLHSAQAAKMTQNHLNQMVYKARDGELGSVMYTTAGVGWKLLHDGPVKPFDLMVTNELSRQMSNLFKVVEEPKPLGRAFAAVTNLFKTYATLSPGFHVRNALSAIFMNTADGVSLANQALGARVWTGLMRASHKGEGAAYIEEMSAKYPGMRDALEATWASGAGGRFGETGFAEAKGGARELWRRANRNWATKLSQSAGEWVEGGVRLGMAMDSIRGGDSVEGALQRISRIHFDYGQVSSADEFMKQIVPFWTYYSRNLPLQIQMMYTEPKAYSWFTSAVASAPPNQPFTPAYWDQPGNFATNTTTKQGTIYGNFDLPFSRSGQQINDLVNLTQGDWKGIVSQANPWFVSPAEWYSGNDFFTGARYDKNSPDSYQKLTGVLGGVMTLMARMQGQTDDAGRVYTPYSNMIRSVLPMIDRAARMDPTGKVLGVEDQASKEPMWMSYARWGGAPLRMLTPQVQESARRGDYYDKKDAAKMQAAAKRYLEQHKAG